MATPEYARSDGNANQGEIMTNLIQCPDCRGSGAVTGFVCSQNQRQLPNLALFPVARERGAIAVQMALNGFAMGEAIRTDRVREHCGGRERARMLGLTPLQLNAVEHGKVDPMEVL